MSRSGRSCRLAVAWCHKLNQQSSTVYEGSGPWYLTPTSPSRFHNDKTSGCSLWPTLNQDYTQKGGFPGGWVVKNLPASSGDVDSIPGSGRSPWRRKWQPTPAFLPGKFHGQGSLGSYSPWDHKESDMTQQLNNNNIQKGKLSWYSTKLSIPWFTCKFHAGGKYTLCPASSIVFNPQ